jgi:hypothetical protein
VVPFDDWSTPSDRARPPRCGPAMVAPPGPPYAAAGGRFADIGESGTQELKRCCVFSRPSVISDSTASAASETWNGSSLRSTVE